MGICADDGVGGSPFSSCFASFACEGQNGEGPNRFGLGISSGNCFHAACIEGNRFKNQLVLPQKFKIGGYGMKKIIVFLLMCFVLTGVSFGHQQNFEKPKLQNKIVEVNYIDANRALGLLRQYMSSYGKIHQIEGTNKVIIEDTPEIVEKILAILKDVDVKPVDLQFNVDLLLGSKKMIPS